MALSLEERVSALEDRASITALLYTYVMGLAARDSEMTASVFSEDAYLDYGFIQLSGMAEIRRYFAQGSSNDKLSPLALDEIKHSNPLIANILIDLDGPDAAHSVARGMVVHHGVRAGSAVYVVRPLLFIDDFHRGASGWRIIRREHPHPPWKLEFE